MSKALQVMPDYKALSVKKIFAEVPATYELVNHLLTFGLDVLWRRHLARTAAAVGPGKWVDMCTGTGETAVYLSRLAPEGTSVYGVDFSEPMLAEAKKKPQAGQIKFVTADIKSLPFDNNTFNVLTMSFATRNINLNRETLIRSFAEYHRVLKPGGCYVNVETSQPTMPLLRKCFHTYIKLFVKAIGSRVSGSRTAYAYLAATIPRFYSAEELADILREAGFEKVTFRRHLFGVVAIHQAFKL